jgi:antitoxin MazE
MSTKAQKWGNSQGVRVASRLLREANTSERVRDRYRLEDLVARMPEDYEPREEDWGAPVGREAW